MDKAPASPVQETPARPRRRDALRNREAILAAARVAFAEEGLEASLEGVARQAGIAIGTLYRHFPTRLALVDELFAEKFTDLLNVAEESAVMDDAWEGFCSFMERFCELQACDRAFNALAAARLPAHSVSGQMNERVKELASTILHRAQRQGAVRADVTREDLVFVVWSLEGIIQATRTIAPRAWRRHLHLMLDAFRADTAHELPEPPLSPQQVDQGIAALECGEPSC
ncbi:MAG: TetR/AcrR family transcriptional regulator [Streptomyces sp.]|uniref:TetR/AcrR family transcriptional regulator n=1 Tax=Streptomyces sp. TaxID=1931 RepID=UPI0025DE7A94|nr:TetR/AcrR family transcriptional regulator [Streptomyces sp.]MBW8800296.1 TetR/AcrR family transcriptional regulator [Streptomyces sp.]